MRIGQRMKADRFIKRIFAPKYHVVWTCTVGVNQSGKTDLNLFIMERLHELGLGYAFGSNVPVEAPFPVDFIEDFQTLKRRCMMINPDPDRHGIKRYFFFASEMGKWAAQDIPWKNTNLIRELQLVRKYGLSVLGDGIDRIDRRIFSPSHFHGFFEKHSKEHPERAVYIDWTKKGKKTTIRHIPQTTIKFNTFHSARFTFEPDIPEGVNVPLNQDHQHVKKYVEAGGSWKKAGIHTQTGKNSMLAVLRYHLTHCLREIAEDTTDSAPSEAEIA